MGISEIEQALTITLSEKQKNDKKTRNPSFVFLAWDHQQLLHLFLFSFSMSSVELTKKSKKRKATAQEESVQVHPPLLAHDAGLEMQSEDEGEGEVGEVGDEDDGEVEEFPEIDVRSDSEDELEEDEEDADEEDEGEDEEESDDQEANEDEDVDDESEDDDETDDDLHIFPKAKTIISDITGQPKRVYPEIEPDYDSDSSTEDVRSI